MLDLVDLVAKNRVEMSSEEVNTKNKIKSELILLDTLELRFLFVLYQATAMTSQHENLQAPRNVEHLYFTKKIDFLPILFEFTIYREQMSSGL